MSASTGTLASRYESILSWKASRCRKLYVLSPNHFTAMLVGNLSLIVFDILFFPLRIISIIFKGSYVFRFGDVYVFTLHSVGGKFFTINSFRYSIERIISLKEVYQLAYNPRYRF